MASAAAQFDILTDAQDHGSVASMNLKRQFRELTDDKKILEFCEFVMSGVDDGNLPDYEKLDLMQVPHLVPNIYVQDYRSGLERGILTKFCGGAINKTLGVNMQGKYMEDIYTGDASKEEMFNSFRRSHTHKEPFFLRRTVRYNDGYSQEKHRLTLLLHLPCTSNGSDVNYSIGTITYMITNENLPAEFHTLTY